MVDISKILKLINKVIDLEEKISTEIKKEKDAKKREKLQKAFRDRDSDALRDLLFGN